MCVRVCVCGDTARGWVWNHMLCACVSICDVCLSLCMALCSFVLTRVLLLLHGLVKVDVYDCVCVRPGLVSFLVPPFGCLGGEGLLPGSAGMGLCVCVHVFVCVVAVSDPLLHQLLHPSCGHTHTHTHTHTGLV